MKFTTFLGVAVVAAGAGVLYAAEPLNLEDETTRINYSLGYQIGGDFKRQGIDMNAAAIAKGIEDALSGSDPLMKPEEMQATLAGLKQKIVAEQKKRAVEQELKLKEESKAFLEENAKQAGITTTESGLQYQIVEEGTGKTPSPTDKVTVNYRGTTVDGKEFDSSYKRGKPASFQLNGVVKGWTEGLQLIKEGGKIKLFIPPELAYGDRGPLAHRALVFDVDLISVGEPAQAETAEGSKEPEAAAEPKK
jgi:FKBP-type peptidyl-prolyl cis-trans isomerase FklB